MIESKKYIKQLFLKLVFITILMLSIVQSSILDDLSYGSRFKGILSTDQLSQSSTLAIKYPLYDRLHPEISFGISKLNYTDYTFMDTELGMQAILFLNSLGKIDRDSYAFLRSGIKIINRKENLISDNIPINKKTSFSIPISLGKQFRSENDFEYNVAIDIDYFPADKTVPYNFGISIGISRFFWYSKPFEIKESVDTAIVKVDTTINNIIIDSTFVIEIDSTFVIEYEDEDNDYLYDKLEIDKYGTDPTMFDTDNDGLSDSEEIIYTATLPTNPDMDNDGLLDGEEIKKYKTDPNNIDTDNDGLLDGIEVYEHKTDPNNIDTDDGGVSDGDELKIGLDPLNINDDLAVPVDTKITLAKVNFDFDSYELNIYYYYIIFKMVEMMNVYPMMEFEIQGHSDDIGNKQYNLTLSQKRADIVKDAIIEKGIDESRIKAVGFGSGYPRVPNNSEENRAINRRIDMLRIK